MNRNITSANAVAILTIDTLYPQGVRLQQFSTDQAIVQAEETIAETRMGVDGNMVAGYTPSIKAVTIQLEPSSPSIVALDTLYRAMKTNKRTYECTLVITLPSLDKILTYSFGVLKTAKPLPDLKKVLDPISYGFDFEKFE